MTAATRRVRLLVALLLDGEVASEVDGLRRALGGGQIGRIAPHVTLVAPVNVRRGEQDEVTSALDALAARTRAFEVMLGPPGTFAPDRPVLFLAVSGGNAELDHLRRSASIGPLASPAGRAERPFVPHVTLASGMSPELLALSARLLAAYERPVVVTRLHLLAQDTLAPGLPWRVHWTGLLGGTTVVGRGGLELDLTVADGFDPDEAAWVSAAWQDYGRATYGPGWRHDVPFVVVARERTGGVAPRGRIGGVASGELRGGICECERLVVDPARRGEGVGSHLLRHVEKVAAERGCAVVRLRTLAGGRAERFYANRGYERSTTLPAWREERDFVVMVKVLRPRPRASAAPS
ncbi:MAG: GNAT family N-acetyltransferase [Acidimicrobiales bacterium]